MKQCCVHYYLVCVYSKGLVHCLDNVGLIPPCDRVLLEMLHLELDKWVISSLREHIVSAESIASKYKSLDTEDDNDKVDICIFVWCDTLLCMV